MKGIAVLGATGSIGRSTLDVISRHPHLYKVHLLAAYRSINEMEDLCNQHHPSFALMGDLESAEELTARLRLQSQIKVFGGQEALDSLVVDAGVDIVVAGIVGFAGLRPTLKAALAGKKILLANKEALVSAGTLFMDAIKAGGATLLPLDSEHNAMHQCLPIQPDGTPDMAHVDKILLTASGGPFRGRDRKSLKHVTPDEACAHPNWSMGRKISIDSATLANKGLELAEACWLFDRTPDQIEVLVHPQSIVHSLISFTDGSILAQLGQPDMRTPIAYCLAWPRRISAGVDRLDLVASGDLTFEAPDETAFPCLALARKAINVPGGMCVFSAANEVAVAAFLERSILFTDIDRIINATLKSLAQKSEPNSIDAVEALDARARLHATNVIKNFTSNSNMSAWE